MKKAVVAGIVGMLGLAGQASAVERLSISKPQVERMMDPIIINVEHTTKTYTISMTRGMTLDVVAKALHDLYGEDTTSEWLYRQNKEFLDGAYWLSSDPEITLTYQSYSQRRLGRGIHIVI